MTPPNDFSSPKHPAKHTQVDRVQFYKDTSLRIHSNEVCRALINAAPDTLLFANSQQYVNEHYELLLALADRREVSIKYDQVFLKEYQTRVACTLETA